MGAPVGLEVVFLALFGAWCAVALGVESGHHRVVVDRFVFVVVAEDGLVEIEHACAPGSVEAVCSDAECDLVVMTHLHRI